MANLVELLQLENVRYWLQIEGALAAMLLLSILTRRRRTTLKSQAPTFARGEDSVVEFLTVSDDRVAETVATPHPEPEVVAPAIPESH